jgi:PAS domain S-box-containing protein
MRVTVEDTIRTGRPHDRVEASLPFLVDGQRTEVTFLVSTTSLAIHGQPRVLVSVMDITERRAAEKALQVERDNLRAILEAAPVGLLVLDPSETVVKANVAAERLFGIRLQDLVSRRCGDLLSCAHRYEDPRGCGRTRHCGLCPIFSAIRKALDKGDATHDLEMEALVGAPGSVASRWFAVTVEPLMLDGSPHAIAALLDITERKRAASELARSEARARAMYDCLPLPTFVWRRTNEAFVLEDCNLAATEVFGEAVSRQFGKPLCDLAEPLRALFGDVERCFQDQTASRSEVNAVLNGGDRILVATHGFVPPDRVLVHVDDVTERRRAEAAVRTSHRLEAIGQLAGGVAHDFNNLLLVINSNADFALEAIPEDDPVRRDLMEIGRAGRRAADLTKQLLAFSRRQLLEPRVLDLNDVVIPLEHMLRRLVGEHIELKIQTSGQPAVVKADPGQLEQVVVNLAVNARDAMPGGGTLLIETAIEVEGWDDPLPMSRTDAGYVRLSVVDSGAGMDAVTRERVFEPFFTTKEVGKGTGLGLATVYGIVTQSDGFVRVESEEGRGTAFHILLPRQSLTVPPQRDTLMPARAEHAAMVLVVEDERAVRQLAERILTRAGYRVMAAASGADALALVQQQDVSIQLLLTDVVMPNMSGKQLADALTVRYPDLRVLFMSGYTDNAIVHHGVLDAGIHFIGKPFTASALTRKVREVLAGVSESSDA